MENYIEKLNQKRTSFDSMHSIPGATVDNKNISEVSFRIGDAFISKKHNSALIDFYLPQFPNYPIYFKADNPIIAGAIVKFLTGEVWINDINMLTRLEGLDTCLDTYYQLAEDEGTLADNSYDFAVKFTRVVEYYYRNDGEEITAEGVYKRLMARLTETTID